MKDSIASVPSSREAAARVAPAPLSSRQIALNQVSVPAPARGCRPQAGGIRLDVSIGAVALVCCLAISVAVSLLSFSSALSSLTEQVRLLVSGAAQEATNLLSASLSESLRLTDLTAHFVGKGTDRATVDYMKEKIPFASWVGFANASGIVLAGSDGLLENRDVSGRRWFFQSVKTRALFYGDVHLATLLQALLAPKAPEPLRFVDVAAPVLVNGDVSHVLCIHLHWDWARDLTRRTLEPVYTSAKTELFVYSADDTILLSPDPSVWKESVTGVTPSKPPACVAAARQSRSGSPVVSEEEWPAPSQGGRFTSACSFMQKGEIEWVVVARTPVPSISKGAAIYASAGAVCSVLLGILLWALVWAGMKPFHSAASDARGLADAVAVLAGVEPAPGDRSPPPLRGEAAGPVKRGSLFREVWTLQHSLSSLAWTVQRAQALKSELKAADEEREELREQLHRLQQERLRSQADLESPLAKAVGALAALRSDPRFAGLGHWAESALDTAIAHLLARGSMLVPDLARQVRDGSLALDRDTRNWLFSELATNQEPPATTSAPQSTQRETPRLVSVSTEDGARGSVQVGVPRAVVANAERAARALVPAMCAWEGFDVFEAAHESGGRPLLAVSLAALEALDLPNRLPIDLARFAAFVALVEDGYRDNPYHNREHAAEVTQGMACLLSHGGLGEVLSPEEQLAAIVASVIHDFEHPGVNNNFLVAVSDPLALRYNDRSPLESHHVSAAWSALLASERNFLAGLAKPALKEIRRTIIDMVLATDMAQHFEIIGAFKKRAAAGALSPPGAGAEVVPTAMAVDDRRLLLGVAIKAVDVGNTARPLRLNLEWSRRISDEFYAQGDREREGGMPVSAFMDRTTANAPKSQVGFMDFIALPLLEALAQALPPIAGSLVASARANYRHWHGLLQAQAVQAQAPAPGPGSARNLAPLSARSRNPPPLTLASPASAPASPPTASPPPASPKSASPKSASPPPEGAARPGP